MRLPICFSKRNFAWYCAVCVCLLAIGSCLFALTEQWPVNDSVFFASMSMTSLGTGGIYVTSTLGGVLLVPFCVLSNFIVGYAFRDGEAPLAIVPAPGALVGRPSLAPEPASARTIVALFGLAGVPLSQWLETRSLPARNLLGMSLVLVLVCTLCTALVTRMQGYGAVNAFLYVFTNLTTMGYGSDVISGFWPRMTVASLSFFGTFSLNSMLVSAQTLVDGQLSQTRHEASLLGIVRSMKDVALARAALVCAVLLAWVALASLGLAMVEHWPVLEALFFCMMAATTVGYGLRVAPETLGGKMLGIVFMLAALALVGYLCALVGVLATCSSEAHQRQLLPSSSSDGEVGMSATPAAPPARTASQTGTTRDEEGGELLRLTSDGPSAHEADGADGPLARPHRSGPFCAVHYYVDDVSAAAGLAVVIVCIGTVVLVVADGVPFFDALAASILLLSSISFGALTPASGLSRMVLSACALVGLMLHIFLLSLVHELLTFEASVSERERARERLARR